jgi:hypothetical protein
MFVRFANSVIIRRSPQDVFGFLSAVENFPRWNYAVVETHITSDGPVGVGATYRQLRSLLQGARTLSKLPSSTQSVESRSPVISDRSRGR